MSCSVRELMNLKRQAQQEFVHDQINLRIAKFDKTRFQNLRSVVRYWAVDRNTHQGGYVETAKVIAMWQCRNDD